MKDELLAWGKAAVVVGISMVVLNEIGRRMWCHQHAAARCAKQDSKNK